MSQNFYLRQVIHGGFIKGSDSEYGGGIRMVHRTTTKIERNVHKPFLRAALR